MEWYKAITEALEPVFLFSGSAARLHEILFAARRKQDMFYYLNGNTFASERSLFREVETIFGLTTGHVSSWDIFDEVLFGPPFPIVPIRYDAPDNFRSFRRGELLSDTPGKFDRRRYKNILLLVRNADRLLRATETVQSNLISLLNELDRNWNMRFQDRFQEEFGTEGAEQYKDLLPAFYRYFYKSVLFCNRENSAALADLLRRYKVDYTVLPELE